MAIDKLKTVFSTGAFINNVKHYFNKINEIIDWINNIGTPSYKVYTILVSQSGTNEPTSIVLKNTLNFTPVWTRINTGSYDLAYSNGFPVGKTTVTFGNGFSELNTIVVKEDIRDNNSLPIMTYSHVGGTWAGNVITYDDVLYNTLIEIRVYN